MRLKLKLAIVKSGLSQRQLARLAELSEGRLSTILHGWITPRAAERERISAALNRQDNLFE